MRWPFMTADASDVSRASLVKACSAFVARVPSRSKLNVALIVDPTGAGPEKVTSGKRNSALLLPPVNRLIAIAPGVKIEPRLPDADAARPPRPANADSASARVTTPGTDLPAVASTGKAFCLKTPGTCTWNMGSAAAADATSGRPSATTGLKIRLRSAQKTRTRCFICWNPPPTGSRVSFVALCWEVRSRHDRREDQAGRPRRNIVRAVPWRAHLRQVQKVAVATGTHGYGSP